MPRFAPDPARAPLAEAGHREGATIRAGIRLEMDVVEHATYRARIRQDPPQPTVHGAARLPVEDSCLSQFHHPRAAPGRPIMPLNSAHGSAADAGIDAARAEPDEAKQRALRAAAQAEVLEAGCSVPLFDLRHV